MLHNTCLIVTIVALSGLGLACAQTAVPATEAALAETINKETGVVCTLVMSRISTATIRHGNDVPRALERLCDAQSLETLSLQGVEVDATKLVDLPELSTLTSLMLSDMRLGKNVIELVSKLPGLKRLQLLRCDSNDEDLTSLANLQSLTWLDLSGTKIMSARFEYLQHLPLRRLNLTGASISDDSLIAIGRIHTLHDLNLNRTQISDKGLMHLVGLYSLYNLPVIDTRITAAGQTAFMESWRASRANAEEKGLVSNDFPSLKILDSRELARRNPPDVGSVKAQDSVLDDHKALAKTLSDELGVECVIGREGTIFVVQIDEHVDNIQLAVERISAIPSIAWASVSRTRVNASMLRKLSRLPRLEVLNLAGADFQDNDLAGIESMIRLTDLDLTRTPITDAALVHLKPLKKLKRLRLSHTKIQGSEFTQLRSLAQLQNLYLNGSSIEDDSLKPIGNLYSLNVLNLSNTGIGDDGINHLTGLYQLVNLGLSGTRTTDAGRAKFHKAFSASRDKAERAGLLSYGHPELVIGHN